MTAGLVYTDPAGEEHRQVPDDWPGWYGGRNTRWSWLLLDRGDQVIKDLDGVQSGRSKLTANVFADTRLTGQFEWAGRPQDEPHWESARVQPWVEVISSEGHGSVRWPMGVLLTATPDLSYNYGRAHGVVEIYDKTLILREAHKRTTFSVPAGADVTTVVRDLVLEVSPSSRVSVDEVGETLRSPIVWDAGESVLRIVNDILAAAGYFSLWADGEGTFRATRYRDPQARPREWEFVSGPKSLHSSRFTVSRDSFKVPNRVLVISRATEDLPALTGEAVLPDSHPLSWVNRGERWVDMVVEGEEATSQAAVQAQAERTLEANTNLGVTAHVSHAALPLEMNGRVLFHSVPNDIGLEGVLQETQIPCNGTGLWTSRMREVAA